MLKNYFLIAWRNLLRYQGFSLVNVLGLAMGMACFLLIIMYVNDELSYDDFHEKSDQIYRVALERKYPDRARSYAMIPPSFAEAMQAEYPEVESACRIFNFGPANMLLKIGDRTFRENNVTWADSNFFELFTIPLIIGNPTTALNEPNSIILTAAQATKFYGKNWKDKKLLGEVIDIVGNDNDPKITGVCTDVPTNSHLKFDFLISSRTFGFLNGPPNYLSFSAMTYLLLQKGASATVLEAKFPKLVTKYASGQVQQHFGVNYEAYQKAENGYTYTLQPLSSIYLDSKLEGEIKPPGSRSRVYFFTLIAILIIAIAGVNFMNLAAARSAGRAKEVGIRKTLGSEKRQLIFQFLMEALMISFMAAILAAVVVSLVLPSFNKLAEKSFDLEYVFSFKFLVILSGLALATGLASGAYPALFMSSFKPMQVLRGKLLANTTGIGLRNALVIFQFAISIFLIAATIIVFKQLNYTQNKSLGFDKEGLITLQNAGGMNAQQTQTFLDQVEALPGVIAVSGCNTMPGQRYFGVSFRPTGTKEMTTGSGLIVDDGFVSCMKMELTDGREFREEFTDSLSVLVNEAAVRELGIDNPVGQQLFSSDNFLMTDADNPEPYTIVGVLKDYHFQSLHHKISPLFLVHNDRGFVPGTNNLVSVRLASGSAQNTLHSIEGIWNQFQPDVPFAYAFMDRDWAALYSKEITSRKVFFLFTLIAIFIACMGLLALASFITEQRTKEISIRKILGASTQSLVVLLSKDFIKLIVISLLIATPLAWYFMSDWLQSFAYRIHIQWWIFALAGIVAIGIGLLTVGFNSLKTALANPVDSLRGE
ncbi:MAG: ABC transporter permease [Bacteroidota bacterium]